MATYDIEADGLRGLNAALQQLAGTTPNEPWEVVNPRGSHAIAVGLDAPLDVTIKGSTGYYCAGHEQAGGRSGSRGSVGPGVAENMMSGTVIVEGDASQYAGATGHGGATGDQGQCQLALRHLDEGDRHRGARKHRAHVGLHGAGGQPRRVRRRGRGAGRQPLRGAPFRARIGQKPWRRLRGKGECGRNTWSFLPTCWSAADATPGPRSSAVTDRPASSTISTSTTLY